MKLKLNKSALSVAVCFVITLSVSGCGEEEVSSDVKSTMPISENLKEIVEIRNTEVTAASVNPEDVADDEGTADIADTPKIEDEVSVSMPEPAVKIESSVKNPKSLIGKDGSLNINNENVGLPTTPPDVSALNREPIGGSTVTLKISNFVPTEIHPDVITRSPCPNEHYFCTDEYLFEVQNSTNKVALDGGEVVVTKSIRKQPEYNITYLKDGIAIPSGWYVSSQDGMQVRFGKVGNTVCFYGSVETTLAPNSDLYKCLRTNENYNTGSNIQKPLQIHLQSFENVVNTDQVADVIANNVETSYSLFAEVQ